MSGYTRQDVTNNIAPNKSANAEDIDLELNQLEDAFSNSVGHKHDGSVGEGAAITVVGPLQEYSASTNSFSPSTNNSRDLGTTSNRWKDLWLAGVARATTFIGNLTGNVTGNTTGSHNGAVGDVTPSTVVATTINASGAITGNLTGNVTGNTTGNHNGAVGNVTPSTVVATTINASGTITGSLTGNVTGNVTGNTTGAHNGVVGNVTPAAVTATTINASGLITASGGVAGNLTGNVTGNLTGNATGALNGTLGATTPNTVVATTVTASGDITSNGSLVYRRNNILGTVSQSVGVPTGAIFQTGSFSDSNTDLFWIKYADGTMINYGKRVFINTEILAGFGALYRSTFLQVDFQENFVGEPPTAMTSNDEGAGFNIWTGGVTTTLSTVGCTLISPISRPSTARGFSWIAIGRWF